MLNEWLRQKITVEEAEAMNMVINEQWPHGRPFGYVYWEWRELLHQRRDGDEIWIYRSSDESWEQMMGQEGIALVRDGEIVEAFITSMN